VFLEIERKMTTPAANAPNTVFAEMIHRVTDESIDTVLGLVVEQCLALLKSTRKIEAAVLHSYVDATAAAALISDGTYVPPAPTPAPTPPPFMPMQNIPPPTL
jgi:hypothetical protein